MMDEEKPALKIAQPFKAGFTVDTKPKVPQGRQNVLSSRTGLGNVCATKPSAEALALFSNRHR
jgi:hypothetical protein